MTVDEVKRYLGRYQQLKFDIEFWRNKMGGMKAISYSQEEKGTVQENMINVYMSKIEEAENKQKEIEEYIESNYYGVERLIIWERYINCEPNKVIGNKFNLSINYVSKYITKAIEKSVAKCCRL